MWHSRWNNICMWSFLFCFVLFINRPKPRLSGTYCQNFHLPSCENQHQKLQDILEMRYTVVVVVSNCRSVLLLTWASCEPITPHIYIHMVQWFSKDALISCLHSKDYSHVQRLDKAFQRFLFQKFLLMAYIIHEKFYVKWVFFIVFFCTG